MALADLVAPDGGDVSAAVARTWQQRVAAPAAGLRAPIGLGPGPGGVALVEVDLLRDGPHALVAGTTGSGKSELLQTLVLGMALRHPPSALTFLLVDYKGGTSLGPCPDLPHVVGHVTDLDAAEAARALRGLTAEVRRREALLARAGVPDLGALGGAGSDGPAPPRLVVVVDEFRTLSEELPDFVPGLVRLAAQGRSLGIHVVLATQRPAGAVTAQMRANLGLRICLRVADAADSTDVVEVPHAADLPSTRPGLALVRRGAAHAEVVQTAWAAAPPGGWTPPPRDGAPVAVRWAGTADASRRVTGASAHTRVLVEACRSAAERRGDATPPHVWLPALPTDVTWSELPVPATGLALGLTDLPDHQARGLLTWPGGVLVVAGGPGSGRTTALRTACLAALDRGWAVHVVDAPGSAGVAAGAVGHHCLGTVVGPDDPGRLARLLLRLSTVDQAPGLLVVDDVAATLAALDQLPRGTASGLLDTVLRDGPRRGLSVALSGAPADVPRLLGQATHRLVLPVTDPAEDVLLGVPRELGGTRRAPGRAVAVGPTGTALCQVAAPPPGADPVASCRPRREGPAPLALRPVPAHVARVRPTAVDRAGPRLDGPWEVPLGLGGDDAGPVVADVRRGLLVIGPAASGRSTALATLHAGLDAAGYRVVLVARSGPLVAASSSDRDTRGRQDPGRLLREARGRADVVLVDDLDLVLRAAPEAEELLLGWLAGAEEDDPSVPRVVATARTDRAASTYRGPLAQLRADAPALVLSPATPGSAEVAGQDLALAVDPLRPTHPGRGVLVTDGHLTVVQVADGISQGPGEEAAGPRRADGSQRRRVRTDRPATRGT